MKETVKEDIQKLYKKQIEVINNKWKISKQPITGQRQRVR